MKLFHWKYVLLFRIHYLLLFQRAADIDDMIKTKKDNCYKKTN